MNAKSAAQLISDDGSAHRIIEGNLLNGFVDTVEISVTDANAIVVATLVWTDPPGTPVAPSLDASDLMMLRRFTSLYRLTWRIGLPWVLNPESPAAAATTGDNFRDSNEHIKNS